MSLFSNSQGEYNNWYFGNHAGVTFNSGSPVAVTNGALETTEGCSTISDATGNLLFHTDGMEVFDRNHNLMPNGAGLLGHSSSTQSGVIVPQPNSSNIYYVFTVDELQSNSSAPLCYSIVDMTLNGGMGDVTTSKNIQLC